MGTMSNTLLLCHLTTPRVQQWLHRSHVVRMLHSFADVCNLVNESGEVMSLVSSQIGAGPFAAVLDGRFPPGLEVCLPVDIDGSGRLLHIGSCTIQMDGAAMWQPRPNWSRLYDLSLANLPEPAVLPAAIAAHLQRLLYGIASQNTALCRAGAAGLAGRGIGLTPTGDDVLVGVLYGMWVWYPQREWMKLIVETAVPRTTTLSAAFLHAAAAGEAVAPWHGLVNGRVSAVSRILAMGHTSGADAWAGFVHTARICKGIRFH